MPSHLLKDFLAAKKKAETSLKAEKNKEYEPVLKAVKDSAKIEKVQGDLDKALDGKDAEAAHDSYADYKTLSAKYIGKVSAELTKIKKKSANTADTDAFADAVTLVAQVQTHDQLLPDKVKKIVDTSEETAGKMETTGLLGEWSRLKKMFEAETGKKKPSETFMGVFRKSSDLENAFKAVDLATKNNDAVALKKAYGVMDKAVTDYGKLVFKQAKVEIQADDEGSDDDDQNPDYNKCVTKLLQGLNRCRKTAKEVLDSVK